MKKIVFTFGRYNPPTTGHAELITYAVKLAQKKGADHRIYTSQSHDPSKNPLTPRQKMAFLRQIFPGVNFVDDPSMKTAFAIARKLVDEGYEDVTFVVGDDRVREFTTQLGKYVKPRTAKDFNPKIHYPFKHFQVVSSGARKKGISGTDLRAAVRRGDFATFAKASATKDKSLAREIFAATRSQLKEHVDNIDEATHRDIRKHLVSQGWKLLRKGTNHDIYSHESGKKRITVPRHAGELDRRLSKEIVKQSQRYVSEEKSVSGMSRKEFHSKLNDFIDFTCNKLGIKEKPSIHYKDDKGEGQPSFGGYSPYDKKLMIYTKNRHPMDIFRTVAHELVHHKQNLDGRLGKDIAKEGSTGSDIENEANSEAGKIMRYFGRDNPFYFDMQYVGEQTAIILSGTPGSGKDKILKEAILPLGFTEVLPNNIIMEGDIVVNGANDYSQVKTIKEQLEYFGYKTMMVFVNTSDEVSRQRNEARASKGGRVINEMVRFAKWQDAQDNLNRFDKLFEKVVEIKNDLDVNKPIQVIQETYGKLIDAVSDEIQKFALTETDYRFERMLNEVGGAGNWGTNQLRQKYQHDTPGEEDAKIRPMEVLDKYKDLPGQAKPQTMPALPIGADRIGQEVGYPKEPTFGDNQTLPFVSMTDPVGRWMVKEETRKRFKEKYGKLAEQKLRETAAKLRGESLEDPFSPTLGMTPNSWNAEVNRPTGGQQIDAEKQGIFGQVLSKKIKKTK